MGTTGQFENRTVSQGVVVGAAAVAAGPVGQLELAVARELGRGRIRADLLRISGGLGQGAVGTART